MSVIDVGFVVQVRHITHYKTMDKPAMVVDRYLLTVNGTTNRPQVKVYSSISRARAAITQETRFIEKQKQDDGTYLRDYPEFYVVTSYEVYPAELKLK